MKTSLFPIGAAGLAATALAGLAAPAGAETLNLGTIVVSANLVPTDASKVGATVTVVTRKELEKSGNATVAEALTTVPGFSLRARGGVGQQTSFSLRGASQNYVGVLVDGIDVTDPSGPQVAYDFGHLSTGGIDRVEVLQGSQSALYGSSAVGGVVDITTRHATEEGVHQYTWLELGSRRTVNGSYSLTVKKGQSDLALTLSHAGTEGYPIWVGASPTTQKDGYWANRLSANGAHTFANGLKLGFAAFTQADHGGYYPGTYAAGGDPGATGTQKGDTSALRLYGEVQTGAVKSTLSAQVFRIDRSNVIASTVPFASGTYLYGGKRFKLAYKGEAALGARARLVFGADTTIESISLNNPYAVLDASRRISGAYAELAYAVTDRLNVTGAVRHDQDSRFGGANTFRLSAAWNPRADITVRASYGTGFRAPSNYELFSQYGNAALQPEKSRSIDLGIEKSFGEGQFLRATLFRLSADNLIGFDNAGTNCVSAVASGFPGCYAQVPGRSVRSGIELRGAAKIGRATLTGSYTYTDSSITASAWAIPPRQMASLDLSMPLTGKLTGGLTLTGAADRANLPNYAVLDARLSYKMDASTELYLRVANVTNAKYQLVTDYAQPGRTVYVGLRKSF